MNIPSERRRVFFEIEQVLACTDAECAEEAAFYKRKGAIVKSALKTHFVFPGVIELLQYIIFQADIGFFSFSAPSKCAAFAKKLLRQAFGEGYPAVKSRAVFLTPENFKTTSKETVFVSCNKKTFPQELQSQVLEVPAASARDYRKPHTAHEKVPVIFWEDNGRPLSQVSSFVTHGAVVIVKTEDEFTIHYSTLIEMIVCRKISPASHPDFYYEVEKGNEKEILNQVALWGGIVDKLRKRKNRLCYIAGVLKSAFVVSNASITFPKVVSKVANALPFRQFCTGLRSLKEINPSFEFITYETVNALFQESLSKALKIEYTLLISNQWARRKICYDIDEVLSCHDVRKIEQVAFFEKFGLIIHAVRSHYVFPGVKEMMQASFESGLEVGFFSAADMERNRPYVRQLLESSLGRYPESVQIFNKTVDFPAELKKAEFEKYGKHTIDKHKDLRVALKPGEELGNVLLADDVHECAAPGQISNLLLVPWTDGDKLYLPDYNKNIFIHVADEIYEALNEELLSGTAIVLLRLQENVEARFLDKETNEVKKAPLINQEWVQTIKETKAFFCPEELESKIREWIAALNGKTTQICRQLNAIYFLTGLLFTVIQESEHTGETLAKTLFKKQFRKIEKGKYKNITHLLAKQDFYYHYGLKILRKYNPSLEFMTPERIKQAMQIEITPELRKKYEAHLNYGKSK